MTDQRKYKRTILTYCVEENVSKFKIAGKTNIKTKDTAINDIYQEKNIKTLIK